MDARSLCRFVLINEISMHKRCEATQMTWLTRTQQHTLTHIDIWCNQMKIRLLSCLVCVSICRAVVLCLIDFYFNFFVVVPHCRWTEFKHFPFIRDEELCVTSTNMIWHCAPTICRRSKWENRLLWHTRICSRLIKATKWNRVNSIRRKYYQNIRYTLLIQLIWAT